MLHNQIKNCQFWIHGDFHMHRQGMLSHFLSIYTNERSTYTYTNTPIPKESTVINMTDSPIFGDIGSSPAMPTFLALLHSIGKYPRTHLRTLSHFKLRAADRTPLLFILHNSADGTFQKW